MDKREKIIKLSVIVALAALYAVAIATLKDAVSIYVVAIWLITAIYNSVLIWKIK